jgi:hypothetical protein
LPTIAFAAEETPQKNTGLFVTPPRQYVDVTAGEATNSQLTVGNLNDTAMKITMSVEQFSVADYTYDYMFSTPKDDWVKPSETQFELGSKESKKIAYTITPPSDATPGGHYYSIFASAQLSSGKQIRAATILYVNVAGDLVQTSEIVNDTLPPIFLWGDVSFTFDSKNTGNTHFFVYTNEKLSGPATSTASNETAHILLPQAIRSFNATLPAPLLPGIYEVQYGYRAEEGQQTQRTKNIIYLPIWLWPTIAGGAWFITVFIKRRKRQRKIIDS